MRVLEIIVEVTKINLNGNIGLIEPLRIDCETIYKLLNKRERSVTALNKSSLKNITKYKALFEAALININKGLKGGLKRRTMGLNNFTKKYKQIKCKPRIIYTPYNRS